MEGFVGAAGREEGRIQRPMEASGWKEGELRPRMEHLSGEGASRLRGQVGEAQQWPSWLCNMLHLRLPSASKTGNQSGLEDRASIPVLLLRSSSCSEFPKSNSVTSLPSGLDYWV